jgi:hypothetical protein
LDHLHIAVLLSACPIYGGEPALLRVIDTGIRHQQMLGLLDAIKWIRTVSEPQARSVRWRW